MIKIAKTILRRTGFCVAVLIITAAVVLGVLRTTMPLLTHFQDKIVAWVSIQMGVPIKVERVVASWRGLQPSIKLRNVKINAGPNQDRVISIKKLFVGVDVWQSLLSRKIQPGRIVIQNAKLSLQRMPDGHLSLAGMSAGEPTQSAEVFDQTVSWLLSREYIAFNNIKLRLKNDASVTNYFLLNLTVSNNGAAHDITGHFTHLNKLDEQIDFVVKAQGAAKDWRDLSTKFYLQAHDNALESWLGYFPVANVYSKYGSVDFQLWGEVADRVLQQIQGEFSLSDWQFNKQQSSKPLSLDKLAGKISLQHVTASNWRLLIKDLQVAVDGDNWPQNEIVIENVSQPLAQHKLIGQVRELRLGDLAKLAQINPKLAQSLQQSLIASQPQAEIHDLQFTLQHYQKQLTGYSVGFNFNDFSLQSVGKIPQIKDLAGRVKLSPQGGELHINNAAPSITFPKLFRQTLEFEQLQSDLSWQRLQDGWLVKVPQFRLSSDNAEAQGQMQLHLDVDGKNPQIEMTTQVNSKFSTSEQIKRYFPVGIMAKSLIDWLDQAIVQAGPSQATLVLRGPLQQFPFDDKSGTFLVETQAKDLKLAYADDWPALEHLNGQVIFSGRRMDADLDSGEIDSLPLQAVHAEIPLMAKKQDVTLSVHAKAENDFARGLQVILQSPLKNSIGKVLQDLKMSAKVKLDLQLKIPLERKNTKSSMQVGVKGDVAVTEGKLSLAEWAMNFTKVRGHLFFTEKTLHAKQLRGDFLGYPATVDIKTLAQHDDAPDLQIDLKGKFSASSLAEQFSLPINHVVAGISDYTARLKILANQANQLKINSQLLGMRINMPAPLNKTTKQAWNSELYLEMLPEKVIAKGMLSDFLSFVLQFTQQDEQLIFDKGNVSLMQKSLPLGDSYSGLLVTGHLPSFDVEKWEGVLEHIASLSKKAGKQEQDPIKNNLHLIDLNIDQLNVFQQLFDNIIVQVSRKMNTWQINLNGEDNVGVIMVPDDLKQQRIQANFSRLNLQELTSKGESNTLISPKKLPSFALRAKDFSYGDTVLGNLLIEADSEDGLLQIQHLDLNNEFLQFAARGAWSEKKNQQYTDFQGVLSVNHVEKLLESLDFPAHLEAKKTNVKFDLHWPSAIYQPTLQQLNGDVALKINGGRILGLSKDTMNKLSLGRVITLLSLQSLPKRMQLDFSDLTHRGYYFDLLQGDIKFKQGNAFTENLSLNGTVAHIDLKGRIGIVDQDYDLIVTVIPHMTSSLPAVATIAGGPIAGAVTWVVDKALSHEVKKITRHVYHVTGSWSEPLMQKQG